MLAFTQRDPLDIFPDPHERIRKSASTRCWRNISAASGRPTMCVPIVPTIE